MLLLCCIVAGCATHVASLIRLPGGADEKIVRYVSDDLPDVLVARFPLRSSGISGVWSSALWELRGINGSSYESLSVFALYYESRISVVVDDASRTHAVEALAVRAFIEEQFRSMGQVPLTYYTPERPNQSPEPTVMSVTPRAGARVAPATTVAHL